MSVYICIQTDALRDDADSTISAEFGYLLSTVDLYGEASLFRRMETLYAIDLSVLRTFDTNGGVDELENFEDYVNDRLAQIHDDTERKAFLGSADRRRREIVERQAERHQDWAPISAALQSIDDLCRAIAQDPKVLAELAGDDAMWSVYFKGGLERDIQHIRTFLIRAQETGGRYMSFYYL